jgi:hypothetical protein
VAICVIAGGQQDIDNNLFSVDGVNYFPMGGAQYVDITSENLVQFTAQASWTLKRFGAQISGNGYTGAYFKTRINGADGNLAISLNISAGWAYDYSHTDSVSATDLINLAFESTQSGRTVALWGWSIQANGSQNSLVCGGNGVSDDSPYYACVLGTLMAGQSPYPNYVGAPGTANSLSVTIATVGSATLTVQSIINGSDGNQSVPVLTSYPAGNYQDTSHTDSWAAGALVQSTFSAPDDNTAITARSTIFMSPRRKLPTSC